ncbi:MAG: sugar ABC transporter ATP-binding protein [Clostridiaceae bacterium]|nr:sugar ABC transporter ATP-binding protein [Clostridiaceae bacterium]
MANVLNASTEPIISIKGIQKSFGQNSVLKGIDMDVSPGEVIALIGGNGAGKSTLVKIIMGIYQLDKGNICVKGEDVCLTKPTAALSRGIYMVPQEPLLFPNMTVEENITIGFKEKRGVLRKRLEEKMEELGWHLDLSRKASGLSIAEQQLVEILRGLMRDAQLLIFDEPTSALTFDEVESLFKCIEDLKSKKIGIIYITHRLAEVFEIATSVAILRDGVVTLSGPISEFTREDLVKGLLPPNAQEISAACDISGSSIDYENSQPVFELKDFSGYGFDNISLKVYKGEILGLAGLVGAGRTELATTIFGRDKALRGKALLEGKDITNLSTAKVIKAGVNYVSEDRHLNGLFKISNVAANITASILSGKELGSVFLNRRSEYEKTQKYIDDFRIKVTGQNQEAGSLSGGNQQKIVIGQAFSTKPKLVIMDEPTRGIDAAARSDVYSIINQLRNEGVAVLLISSDMEEIVELSDRAVSVYQGRINGEFQKCDINQDNLMSAAFGLEKGKETAS